MGTFSILYTILIGPLKLLFEVIYSIVYYFCFNEGLSILILSLFMNFLLLPLYNRADDIQNEENETEKKLKLGVDHIKKTFKGDERYMMLQTYYRENNYKPIYSLKGLLPLLLEIPFFIAAYSFLSNLNLLSGATFGPITDLSKSDGLIYGVNILPILMTVINIVSSLIYTKDAPLKTKLQLYIMAILFLIVLYDSPSGLVLYWTTNNLFSLIKNIFNKFKNKQKILNILCGFLGIIGIIFVIVHPLTTPIQQYGSICIFLIMQLPLLLSKFKIKIQFLEKEPNIKFFVLSSLLLSAIVGLLIPSYLINASPTEFIDTSNLKNPIEYIFNCFLISFGFFAVWLNIYYLLSSKVTKKLFELVIAIANICFVVNFMFFGKDLGLMNNTLEFDDGLVFSNSEILLNSIVWLLIVLVSMIAYIKNSKIFNYFASVLLVVCVTLSGINLYQINKASCKYIEEYKLDDTSDNNLLLSTKEKNVLVILLDRAISAYFPYYLSEKPELEQQFSGFTFYPNTISYGNTTFVAARVIYGGYEYTPEEINKRSNETISSKNDEALKVLPTIFSNNNYDVYLSDVPYAGDSLTYDMSIYNDIENINTFKLTGKYVTDNYLTDSTTLDILNRNLFCYSFMKIMPVAIEQYFYNGGFYNNAETYVTHFMDNKSIRNGMNKTFIDNYTVLENLNNIVSVSDKEKGSLVMVYNCTTHEDTLLQEPEYIPQEIVNNVDYDNEHAIRTSILGDELILDTKLQAQHYQVGMAAMIQLGKFFDYLKDNNAYDNTKIIIVSDHGCANTKPLYQFDDMILNDGDNKIDLLSFNPLLLVKDYDDTDFKVSDEFMTNADVPEICLTETIDDFTNPYTANNILTVEKSNKILILDSNEQIGTNTFNSNEWLIVNNNIFDLVNWSIINNK